MIGAPARDARFGPGRKALWAAGLAAGLIVLAALNLSGLPPRALLELCGALVTLPFLLLPPMEVSLALVVAFSPLRSLSTQPVLTFLVGVMGIRWLLALLLQGRYRTVGPRWRWQIRGGAFAFFPLPWLVTALAVVALIAFAHVPAALRYSYLMSVAKVLTFLLFFVLLVAATGDEVKLYRILQGVMVFGAMAVFVGVLQILFPSAALNPLLFPDKFKSTGEMGWVTFRQLGGVTFFRIGSFFTYVNGFAGALALLLPLQGFMFAHARSVRQKILYLIFILLTVICFLATIDRSAWLAFAAGALYFLVRSRRLTWSRKGAWVAATGATVAGFAFWTTRFVGTGQILARFAELLHPESTSSVVTRSETYALTLRTWLEYPVLGHGVPQMYRHWPYPVLPLGSHSTYLYHLYAQGVVGLFLFLAILVVVWREARFARRHTPPASLIDGLGEVLFLDVLILTVHSLLISYEAGQGLYGLFVWTVLGLAVAAGTVTRHQRAP